MIQVLSKEIIRIDYHGCSIFLNGEKEVRELDRELTNALFEMKRIEREGKERDGG